MRIKFRNAKLSAANLGRLVTINGIISEYQKQGYVLSLRQLYYQLVSRDIIPNKQAEYAKLSTLLKEGRMAGIVDWAAIEDRTRQPYSPAAFDSPEEILDIAIRQFQLPRQAGQSQYVEVWVEKDALSGVLKRVTAPYHVPILVNKGYGSASAMFDAYERFRKAIKAGQKCTILYLGDYDPSGIDMIRDVKTRVLEMLMNDNYLCDTIAYEALEKDEEEKENTGYFLRHMLEDEYNDYSDENKDCLDEYGDFDVNKAWIKDQFGVRAIALTREQIDLYKPPPNPAKLTDPRSKKFIAEKGSTSWEVDALKPEVLNAILDTNIRGLIDIDKYKKQLELEKGHIKKLEGLTKYLK